MAAGLCWHLGCLPVCAWLNCVPGAWPLAPQPVSMALISTKASIEALKVKVLLCFSGALGATVTGQGVSKGTARPNLVAVHSQTESNWAGDWCWDRAAASGAGRCIFCSHAAVLSPAPQ